MAGTVVLSSDKMYGEMREVIFTCTSDASLATIPDTDLCALAGTVYGTLSGWALAAVETKPGTTGPTDNTDMYLLTDFGSDMLAAGGENMIDNTTPNLIKLNPVVWIGPKMTLDVNAQAVNSAVYYIKLTLVRYAAQ